MNRYHAAWVLPIEAPPLRDAWISTADGRVLGFGTAAEDDSPLENEIDLGPVAILPGLVNAHTHLELSYLKGRIPSGGSFTAWIRAVMGARRGYPDPRAVEILAAIEAGIAEAIACGTAAVGDISNTLVTCPSLGVSPLAAVVFHEIIGFNPKDPVALVGAGCEASQAMRSAGTARTSLAAHAPYSVAPDVFRAIAEAVTRHQMGVYSVHLAESRDEVEFLQTGGGAWRQLLEDFGVWNPSWTPPRVGPVQYLDSLGFLSDRLLVVHGVQMTASDLASLRAHDATLVTCPRSNAYTGAGTPPIADFYASGVKVAIGTDSLASTPDLNVFAELALMRRLAPQVPASKLLESATKEGARALGLDGDWGSIAPGKRARLLAVRLPDEVDDVEEYLVSGIQPEQITWIES